MHHNFPSLSACRPAESYRESAHGHTLCSSSKAKAMTFHRLPAWRCPVVPLNWNWLKQLSQCCWVCSNLRTKRLQSVQILLKWPSPLPPTRALYAKWLDGRTCESELIRCLQQQWREESNKPVVTRWVWLIFLGVFFFFALLILFFLICILSV